jgi:hypothetical protein
MVNRKKDNDKMKIVEKILDALGFSVIPYAFGLLKFKIQPPIDSSKLGLIKERIKGFTNKNADEALSYCKELFEEEMKRGGKIENKAYSLIGVTGVSAAFITGIPKLLPEKTIGFFLWHNISIMVVYILIVISLTFTILLASRVVIVGGYKFAYPDVTDIFNINSQSLLSIKKERLNAYLYCYINNCKIHNIKASFLIGSQIWFRNTIILFLILAFILAPSIFSDLNGVSQNPPTTATIVNSSIQVIITSQPTAVIQATSIPGTSNSPILQVSPTIRVTAAYDSVMTASRTPHLTQTP